MTSQPVPIKNPSLQKAFQNIKISINHDLFRYGILKSHQKLQNANLRRMIQYCLKKQSPNSKNKELSTSDTGRPQTSGMDGSNPTTTLNENLCYPILSWQSWRYIAVNKLQITDTLAWAYFDTYLALNFESDASKRKQICC